MRSAERTGSVFGATLRFMLCASAAWSLGFELVDVGGEAWNEQHTGPARLFE